LILHGCFYRRLQYCVRDRIPTRLNIRVQDYSGRDLLYEYIRINHALLRPLNPGLMCGGGGRLTLDVHGEVN
jgi:hypothetical protein